MTHLESAIHPAENEFFAIKASLNSDNRTTAPVLISYPAWKTAQREVLRWWFSVRQLVPTLLGKVCGTSLKQLAETYYQTALPERT